MRVVIQHAETGRYLNGSRCWIEDPARAMAFIDETRARDYGIYHRLQTVAVVVLPDSQPEPAAPNGTGRNGHELETDLMKSKLKPVTHPAPSSKAKARPEKGAADADALELAERAATRTARPALPKTRRASTALDVSPPPTRSVTCVEAKIDVGLGNQLFVRGEGGGLSWEKGAPLECVHSASWIWATSGAADKVTFKLLLNDQRWSKGSDLVVQAGQRIEVVPEFE